ncbi:MAG TPA: hypothetical protein VFN42_11945, partial [Acetobacteraceae bacterium]|nr:hypothetical protein [Acetobacteraceae bacterium]
ARSAAVSRGPDGTTLGFLGRAHPLVRRAIMRGMCGPNPLSAARVGRDAAGSALLTYSVELHSGSSLAMRRVIAVLVPASGPVAALMHPKDWLHYADPDRTTAVTPAVLRGATGWLASRQAEAMSCAHAAARHMAEAFARTHRRRMQAATDALQAWLRLRTKEICGAAERCEADLFGAAPSGPAWRTPLPALERLAAFARDAENPPGRRREANSVVALFSAREAEVAEQTALSAPVLRPLGLLMLVAA